MTDPVDVPLPDDDDSRRKSEHVQGIVQETIERQRKKGILNPKNQQDKEEQKPVQQTNSILDGVRKGRLWLYSLAILSILSGFGTFFLTRMYYEATVIPRAVELYKQELEGLKDPKLKKASIPTAPASSVAVAVPASSPASAPPPTSSTEIICTLVGDGVHKTKEAEKNYNDAFSAFMNVSTSAPEYEKVSKTYENAKKAYVPIPSGQEVAKESIPGESCDKWEKQKALELFMK